MKEKERRELGLPKRCDCGGRLLYSISHSRVFSVCRRCSPVTRIDTGKLRQTVPTSKEADGANQG
jgi:hypothetical protein